MTDPIRRLTPADAAAAASAGVSRRMGSVIGQKPSEAAERSQIKDNQD